MAWRSPRPGRGRRGLSPGLRRRPWRWLLGAMGASIRLGRVWGIPLGVNYTWFIVFFLVTFSLAWQFGSMFPRWGAPERWGLALATSLLFFCSVLFHELAHSVLAVRLGIPVRGITLFVFGGVSHISREASRPRTEFLVAVVGPLSSFLLAGAFFGLAYALHPFSPHIWAGALVLGQVNLALGAFNLLPGFPLDGGRVLRSALWASTGNYLRATRIASLTGQGMAFLFIGVGVILALRGLVLQGVWLALIGWFLESAASAYYRQFKVRELLRGYHARDLMSPDCPRVPPTMSIRELVEREVLTTGRRCFLVGDAEHTYGMVTLRDARRTPRDSWEATTVAVVMVPLQDLRCVHPGEEAYRVLEIMDEADVNQVPVVEGGQVVGLISRDGVIRFIRVRDELGL